MDRRRLLLGDWGRVVRDPIDVLRICFIAGTAVYWVLGRPIAIGLTAASLVLVIARFVNLPRPYDLMLMMAMVLIAFGSALDLYSRITYYDKAVHGLSPIMWAPVLYIVCVRLEVLPDLGRSRAAHHLIGMFLVTFALGAAVGAAYEISAAVDRRIASPCGAAGHDPTAHSSAATSTPRRGRGRCGSSCGERT